MAIMSLNQEAAKRSSLSQQEITTGRVTGTRECHQEFSDLITLANDDNKIFTRKRAVMSLLQSPSDSVQEMRDWSFPREGEIKSHDVSLKCDRGAQKFKSDDETRSFFSENQGELFPAATSRCCLEIP